MAKRMNADDQFKFLLSCVKWSNNGKVRSSVSNRESLLTGIKVDFMEVARECEIVSKAAA